jgi:hypothetical protein
MYARATTRGLGGFWSTLIGGSVKAFEIGVPTAATAGAAGPLAAGLTAASSTASALKGKSEGGASGAPQTSANWLASLTGTEVAILGIAGVALVAAMAKGRR